MLALCHLIFFRATLKTVTDKLCSSTLVPQQNGNISKQTEQTCHVKQLPEVKSIPGTGKILEHISHSTAIRESIGVILYFCHGHPDFRTRPQFTERQTGHSYILMKYLALDCWLHLDLTEIPFLIGKKSAWITSALCRLTSHMQIVTLTHMMTC